MTEPEEWDDEWAAAVLPFFENPKSAAPDIKALVRLLRARENRPLPGAFRGMLAEILDSRFGGDDAIAMNWQLGPVYRGWHEKRQRENEQDGEIAKAMAAGQLVTDAINQIEVDAGMSARTGWTAWTRIRLKRAWSERVRLAILKGQRSPASHPAISWRRT